MPEVSLNFYMADMRVHIPAANLKLAGFSDLLCGSTKSLIGKFFHSVE
jgi:hypothetical protein